MKRIIVLAFCLLIAACTPKPISQSHFMQGKSAQPIIKSAKVEVSLTRFEVKAHPDFTQLYWSEASSRAMDRIGTEFVRLAPLVHGIISPRATLNPSKLLETRGAVRKTPDPQTGDYRQQAEFNAVFVPEKILAGQIVRLEDDRDIASMKDRMSVRLFSAQTISTPAYFLVAERIEGDGPDFLKIIGWGKIIQSLEEPIRAEQASMGSLCLAEIEESSKEVQRGDVIFLLEVSGTALQPATPTSVATTTEEAVIIVEPKWEPEPEEPTETK